MEDPLDEQYSSVAQEPPRGRRESSAVGYLGGGGAWGGLRRTSLSFKRGLLGGCAILAVGLCAFLALGGRRPAAAAVADAQGSAVGLFDMSNLAEGYVFCYQNKTYYTEVNGKHAMMFGQRSQEISPYACQFRCTVTPGCSHFSFWSDGGCLLTSFTAYSQLYLGFDNVGVMSGPRSCSSVLIEEEQPTLELSPALGVPPLVAQAANECGGLHSNYALAWKAQGRTFFDDWQFLTTSETHGAEWYLNKSEAFRNGVVLADDHSAILRVGNQQMPFKRHSVMIHSAQAWRPDRGFMVVMKYRHVPFGAGIWPAFWLMNSDYLWPGGGELDILEYANDDPSKVTFHTNKNCSLHNKSISKCMRGADVDNDIVGDCYTNYTSNKLGCKPPQIRRNGKWFAENPGAIATAWDASGVYVFHIPEQEIPLDLESNAPNPTTWERWMIAYLPFDPDSCFDVAKPQEIVLNIALCGDWAGGAWWTSDEAHKTGFLPPYCNPGKVTEPATDCCTIFMSHPSSEHYIKSRAFFDIEYIKVFEPSGVDFSNLSAGTYRNDGEPLAEPCIACGNSRTNVVTPGGGNICCLGCGQGTYTLESNGTLTCPPASS